MVLFSDLAGTLVLFFGGVLLLGLLALEFEGSVFRLSCFFVVVSNFSKILFASWGKRSSIALRLALAKSLA